MSVVLSDDEFKTVLKAIAHCELELHFLHGLNATDNDSWDDAFVIDTSETLNLINEANGILDKSKRGIKLSKEEEETLKKQLLEFSSRVSSSKASCAQEILVWPDILKILLWFIGI